MIRIFFIEAPATVNEAFGLSEEPFDRIQVRRVRREVDQLHAGLLTQLRNSTRVVKRCIVITRTDLGSGHLPHCAASLRT